MRIKILRHLLVIILAIVLTTALTWPFATKLGSYYTDVGDYTGFGSMLWWSFESVINGRIFDSQQYFNGYQLYPMPYTFAYGDHLFIPSLIFGLYYSLSKNFVFSVNFLSFTSLIFSFLSCFYILNHLIISSSQNLQRLKVYCASLIGATIFTFNPLTSAQFPQHAYLFNRFLLPPLFLFAYKFFKLPGPKNAFYLGLFFTLNALSVIYYQIYTIFLLVVLSSIYIFINLYKKNILYIFQLMKNSLVILIFVPLLLYFNLPYLKFNNLEGAKRSIEQNIYYSARVADWFSPSRSNLLYGDLGYALNDKRSNLEKNDIYYHEEHSLFLNFVPLFLFIVFIGYFLKKRKEFPFSYLTSPIPMFVTILFISFIMTFGPVFTGWNGEGGGLRLPFYFFYEYLPFGKGVRVPPRFQFIFYLPFALFCAYGALRLFDRFKKYFPVIFIIILGLLVAENVNKFSFDGTSYILPKVEGLNHNNQLSFLRNKNVLHLPIIFPDFVQTEGIYHNWRVVTGEKIVNMHSGYNPQEQINLLLRLKEGIGLGELRQLSAIGVDYLVIHRDLINQDIYKNKFQKYDEIYNQGIVLSQEDTRIISLDKYDFQIHKCDFEKDFDINLTGAVVSDTSIFTNILVLKNKNDCFLPSIYNERYKTMDFYPNFIKKTVSFKLPIIINPYEEVILSEINNELKIR